MKSGVFAFFLAAALLLPANVRAQNDGTTEAARNAIYAEVLGNAGGYSINYERRFSHRWLGRIGFEVMGDGNAAREIDFYVESVPVMASYLFQVGTHDFEAGGGIVFGYEPNGFRFGPGGVGVEGLTGSFGYRYHPEKNGFLFRAGLTPFFSTVMEGPYLSTMEGPTAIGNLVWVGVSFGYAF